MELRRCAYDYVRRRKTASGSSCRPEVAEPNISKQYLSYPADGELASRLFTWLSYRSENFRRIKTFRLQLFSPEATTAAEEFINKLAISPSSSLHTSIGGASKKQNEYPLDELLLQLPEILKIKGEESRAENNLAESIDYHGSALHAMSGWRQHRRSSTLPRWNRLFFDLINGKLQSDQEMGTCTKEEYNRQLNYALSWAYVLDGYDRIIVKHVADTQLLCSMYMEERYHRGRRCSCNVKTCLDSAPMAVRRRCEPREIFLRHENRACGLPRWPYAWSCKSSCGGLR